MPDRVQTVVVGYGFAGRDFHCYLIRLAEDLALRGVVSGDAAKRSRVEAEQGCRTYATLDEALADPGVDLIVLATPNATHADLAVKALDAGKHVVTDKLMCLTLADCDRMIGASERAGRLLTVFQNRRFDGDFLTAQRLIADGRLGDLRWAEMAWQGFSAMGGWRGQAAMGGGRLYDLGAHLIDQLCLLFPQEIETVYCRMRHDWPGSDTESEALLVVTFEGGGTAVCDLSSMAAISKPRFYLRGTGGAYRKCGLDPQERAMLSGDIDAAREDPATFGTYSDGATTSVVETLPGRWRSYYENVADVLLRGAAPCVRLPEMRRQIAVIEAAVRSGQTGEVVRPNLLLA